MDGFFSGAVVKKANPDCEMVGWDYKDPVPNMDVLKEYYHEVILIDITFPFEYLQELGKHVSLLVFDHHISFYRQTEGEELNFSYHYSDKMSACEVGYTYYIGEDMPQLIIEVGNYDTYRNVGTEEWESKTLPIKYALYGKVNKYEDALEVLNALPALHELVKEGEVIMDYVRTMNESMMNQHSFVREVYGGLKAVCVNTNFFNTEMLRSMDTEGLDLAVGFCYVNGKWGVSLRCIHPDVDVSVIAKKRGGGGHFSAAGFGVDSFEKIFI